MLKHVDVATYNSFMAAKNGKWKAGVEVLGLKDGGVGYAVDKNNEKILDARGEGRRGPGRERHHFRARFRCTTTCPTTSARRNGVASPRVAGRGFTIAAAAVQEQRVTTAADPPAIELIGIDKSFGPVHANNNVNLTVERGVIHGIVGENGAGKSTLMSILYGFYEADAGEIRVNGKPVRIRSSREAISHGIGMVFQHFMLVQPLSVLENVMLGAEGGPLLAEGAGTIRKQLAELGREYGLEVHPDAIVGELSVGLQQRVEILKALVRGAEILVLDEPTAVLTPAEADQLFEMLRVLKSENKTIIFITHKLREIMDLTDRVSVMRRGEIVADFETAMTSPPELADAMVGRKVILRIDKGPAHPGSIALEARNLVVRDDRGVARVDGVSFIIARRRDPWRGRRRRQRPVGAARGARRHPAVELRRDPDRRRDGAAAEAQPAHGAAAGRRPRARGSPPRRARHAVRSVRERDARLSSRAGLRAGLASMTARRSSPMR